MLRSDNGLCYSSREFQQFIEFYQVHHTTSSPHHPQGNGITEALVGILKKLMEKSIKYGKPWNYGLIQYHVKPISSTIPSPFEALTDRKQRTSLAQIPLTIGKSVESSRICQQLINHQQPSSTSSSSYSMELEPGQSVFIKEVHGNVLKTGTMNQPAKEPDSYWVRFPDDSILRRSLLSHFELESAARERNSSEFIPSGVFSNFQSMLSAPEPPALQTGNLVTSELSEHGALPMRKDIPTSSAGLTQPSIPAVRRSSHSTKGVPPRRFSPSRT